MVGLEVGRGALENDAPVAHDMDPLRNVERAIDSFCSTSKIASPRRAISEI